MIKYLKQYKAFLLGLLIIPIFYFLEYLGFIKIPSDSHIVFNYFTLFWGLLIGAVSYFSKYIKRSAIWRILSIIVLLFVAIGIDSFMNMPDNPVTFILLLAFWLGLAYLLFPSFIKKYWKLIALFYIPLLLYFIYLRLFTGGLDAYLILKEDFPFFIMFFVPIPIMIIVWIFEQWRWVQNLKAEKAKTELSLLRTQINPHFFFNTLNNLYALTVKNSKQAPEIILKLSDMMRYTIYEGEKEQVKIKDEIEYLNNYIELHRIRYKKSHDIKFEQDIDHQLTVAPLLFIILLENAFKHGIETLTENGYIHMRLYEKAEYIYFDIENNFDAREIASTKGIGLNNLKRRLSLLYPETHTLKIDKKDNTYKVSLKIRKHA